MSPESLCRNEFLFSVDRRCISWVEFGNFIQHFEYLGAPWPATGSRACVRPPASLDLTLHLSISAQAGGPAPAPLNTNGPEKGPLAREER